VAMSSDGSTGLAQWEKCPPKTVAVFFSSCGTDIDSKYKNLNDLCRSGRRRTSLALQLLSELFETLEHPVRSFEPEPACTGGVSGIALGIIATAQNDRQMC
jgi:hypothetical protein